MCELKDVIYLLKCLWFLGKCLEGFVKRFTKMFDFRHKTTKEILKKVTVEKSPRIDEYSGPINISEVKLFFEKYV